MKKYYFAFLMLILCHSILVSQAATDNEEKFNKYFGSVDINYLAGVYNSPLTLYESTLEKGGIRFEDFSTVNFMFDKDKMAGTIIESGVETKFTVTKERDYYKVFFVRSVPDQKKYCGKIVALNSKILRILYFDLTDEFVLDEFTRLE